MKITQTTTGDYTLSSVETHHASKKVYIRYTSADGDEQHARLEDLPIPLDPGPEPKRATDADAREAASFAEAHDGWEAQRAARAKALTEQRWTAWLADTRPDHVKAEEHFRRARGLP
jgi:hypothetical protein